MLFCLLLSPPRGLTNEAGSAPEISPEQSLRALALARTATLLMEPAKARETLERLENETALLLEKHPDNAPIHSLRGDLFADLGNKSQAMASWLKAVEIDPLHAPAQDQLAQLALLNGDTVNAAKRFRLAVEGAPNEAHYRYELGLVLQLFRHQIGEAEGLSSEQVLLQARDQFQQAVRLDPANMVHARILAEIYYSLAEPDWVEAAAAWEKVIAMSTDPDRDRTHLVRVSLYAKDLLKARQVLDSITDPKLEGLKKTLARRIDQAANLEKTGAAGVFQAPKAAGNRSVP